MKTKALAIQPLNSLNLRTILTNKAQSKDIVHPTKPVPSHPHVFEEILFHLDDVPNASAYDDLFEDLELDHDYFSRLSTLLKPETPIGAALQRNALYATISSKGCLHRVANSLDRIGYSTEVTSSAAAAATKKGTFYNLRHEYISINLDGKEYIVDPSFKEHFVVQNPTTRYAAVLALVPDTVVIAPRQQLLRAVTFLATELQRCFEARRVALPPWRKLKSLLSKWEAATQVAATHRAVEAPSAVAPAFPLKTFIKAKTGAQFVTHSWPDGASTSPQSVLDNQGILTTESREYPKRFVGFQIATKGDECVCCGLRRKMLRQSTQQDMESLAHSAPAA